ncbi:hypothetical protein [Lentzea flava]|uniref:Lipoprotein n=1 Tax=Lentzea flava TaxID=103732 RepID=A0ABQ2UDT0_9PSEU|nr:hypothetical protein [Lentzea flava]MCP2196519.1 hypothetical protein [Lentzea flava]GGU17388.1 hypothetical protein GCM10010178_06540 [Lentzea flava]
MRKLVFLVLLVAALVSCGRNEPRGFPMNVPELTKAADAVQPLLEERFASSYAGLEVRNDVPMLVVYRKPDENLDAEVTRVAPDVRIEFRDARYTRVEMAEHVKRVMDDGDFWKARGIRIVSAAPEVDGSGVRVGAVEAPDDLVHQLEVHYPAMSFKTEKTGEIVPA